MPETTIMQENETQLDPLRLQHQIIRNIIVAKLPPINGDGVPEPKLNWIHVRMLW